MTLFGPFLHVLAQDQSPSPSDTNIASPVPSATPDASHEGVGDSRSDKQDTATADDSMYSSSFLEEQTLADDSEIPAESFDASYEETGLPGAVSLNTPDYVAIPTPMFEIGSNVVLGWSYSNDTLRPPAKVSICGRYPPDYAAFKDRTGICDWVVASNLTGGTRSYTWDTVTQGAPGYSFFADAGYMMYIYDGDFGVGNANPGAGRITPFAFTFSMYNSQYGNTNQGVPVGYNPNIASSVNHPVNVGDKGNNGGGGDNRDLTVNIGGATATTAASSGFGISLNNGGDSAPSKTSSSKLPSSTSSGSSNGQPGRITMKTPPQSVASPLFEIASTVQLQWDYDNNMKKPPSQITIRGQMPSGFFQPGTTKPLYWYIAQNVSAAPKAYNWDTITESPPGYTLREGSGYKLYIYDSDIGWDNSTHVYPGKLFQFMLPFSMYNSRYAQSNDGVPKNYNPNAAPRSASAGAGAWVAMLAAAITASTLIF
ncbi:hypothetical protein IW152_001217 [Coemansia sp. BCRC 34962]|nr:hypothetical protein IW152_001217 [Coemansia sp. BCRC 34962]